MKPLILDGFMLVNAKGGVFLASELPNLWPTKSDAGAFARKYSIFHLYKPLKVTIRFKIT